MDSAMQGIGRAGEEIVRDGFRGLAAGRAGGGEDFPYADKVGL